MKTCYPGHTDWNATQRPEPETEPGGQAAGKGGDEQITDVDFEEVK